MRGWPLVLLVVVAGCSRAHYRTAADRETYPVIAEHAPPDAPVGRTHVEPLPGSRLHDPFDPDRPPKPPDDPAADVWMRRPGGLRGSRKWGQDGHTDHLEGPGWEHALPLDDKGALKLSQDAAVEVALRNSRGYQTALENVYLRALALTLNRFEFDIRWFGRNTTTFAQTGLGGVPTESNQLAVNSDLGFERNFAAGGQLLVDFANSLTYEYTGDSHNVGSNIAVTLVQPLLRGAGRKFRLEGLTQAERDTLYAVREFARFRKQFWGAVAVGAGDTGPGGGRGGGYLDLLLALQTARNARANLTRQEETYRLYSELFRGGRVSVVELDQFFQSLQAARLAVIDADVSLETALDVFKLQLGLPPRLPVELDDALLNQFQLTDPELEKLRESVEAFQRDRLKELDNPPTADALRAHFAALRGLADRLPGFAGQVNDELDRLGLRLGRPPGPNDAPEQRDRAVATLAELKKQLPAVLLELKKRVAEIDTHRGQVTDDGRKASWEALAEDTKRTVALVDAVVAVQTQARIYLIELPEVDRAEGEAVAFAKENRLDLQNQLAQVTDTWRRVAVAANALRPGLDVVATANVATDPDVNNPIKFGADASRYTLGVRFDGPLNRMAERNAYRASLITYQRAKRDYVELSDGIEFAVRNDLRTLNQLRAGFEINRQQLLSAARQYENARFILLGPQGRQGKDTTTLDLLRALDTLLTARNALARSFINYEQARVQLLLDLEELQLDQRGFPANASGRLPDRAPDRPAVRPDAPVPGPAPPPRPGP